MQTVFQRNTGLIISHLDQDQDISPYTKLKFPCNLEH